MIKVIVIMSVLMALQIAVAKPREFLEKHTGTGQYCESANLCSVWIHGRPVKIQLAGVPASLPGQGFSEDKIANRNLSLTCKGSHQEPFLCTVFWGQDNINLAVIQHLENLRAD